MRCKTSVRQNYTHTHTLHAKLHSGEAALVRDAVDGSVHRRRLERLVEEGAEARLEDDGLEEVGREADDRRLEEELLGDVARDGDHREAAVEELLLLKLELVLRQQRAHDVERVEAKVAGAARLRVLVELEAHVLARAHVRLLERAGEADRDRERRGDLPLLQPTVEERRRLARRLHEGVAHAEARRAERVDEDGVEDFLKRPRDGG